MTTQKVIWERNVVPTLNKEIWVELLTSFRVEENGEVVMNQELCFETSKGTDRWVNLGGDMLSPEVLRKIANELEAKRNELAETKNSHDAVIIIK